jgi:hypothetical protein
MSYTSERWHFQDNTRYQSPWTTNPYSITTRKPGVHGTTIANIPNRKTVPDAEQRANAMLMAHAPEMLALLRTFVGWYSNKESDNFHKVMPFKNQPPEIQTAMKLIEKTTGETYV